MTFGLCLGMVCGEYTMGLHSTALALPVAGPRLRTEEQCCGSAGAVIGRPIIVKRDSIVVCRLVGRA